MIINDAFISSQSIVRVPVRALTPDAQPVEGETALQREHRVDVKVCGVHVMTITCSPDHLPELVLGRLFSEGVIQGAQDVEAITVDAQGQCVDVRLVEGCTFKAAQVENVPTTGAGSPVFATIAGAKPQLSKLAPIAWDPQWIFAMSQLLVSDTPMHKVTFGVHSCFLSLQGTVLYCCEDLGRHNAFDKIVGCALRDQIDLSQCVVFSSGRLPVDMVSKAVRARIPVLASKAVPTDATLRIARDYDLTLVCSAHPDKMLVLNDPCAS